MVKRRRLAPLFMVWTLLACGAGSVACAGIFGFERLSEAVPDEGGPPLAEASTETGPIVPPTEAGPACSDLGIPDRPQPVDAGSDAPAVLHMALKLIDFGIDQSAAPVGFNLDRACSPDVATSTCKTSIDEATFDKYGKDKNAQGLDNSGFALLAYLARLGSAFAPDSINQRLAAGEFGAVLRLSSWNGTPDDDDVFVEIFPAIGVWNHPEGGPLTDGGVPVFKADDQWIRDRRFQNVVDASRIKSASAWVTGGRLVASFQSVTLGVSVPDDTKPLDVTIQEAYLSGMLVPDGTSWRVDKMVLGGRWRTADILSQVRTIYIKDTLGLKNVYLCDPGLLVDAYGAVKKEVCDGRDLRSSSLEDSKSLPCDSFSAGVAMNSYAVDVPGDFGDLPAIAPRCQKDGSVPAGDDCAP